MRNLCITLVMFVLTFPSLGEEKPRVPGIVIDYSPAKSKEYIGSPSLAVLPNGNYVASHDLFGPGSTKDRTLVFQSTDRGKTWQKISDIKGQWWSTLFWHKDALYLMGTSNEYGFTVIRKSMDGGKTWTEPKDRKNGLLLGDGKYHCAPVPVVLHNNRIWRAMEDAMGPGGWGSHFRSFMMSAPIDSDLLKAESWTCSNRLGRNPDWLNKGFGGWLEGNAVVRPDGKLVNILRADSRNDHEKVAMIEISENGKEAKFDPEMGFLDFPGGAKKFTIRFDPQTKRYWSLSNLVPQKHREKVPQRTRNTLALICSEDLKKWEVRSILLYHPDTKTHGFQYVDWLIEAEDLIAVCRTAFDDDAEGAHNQHDANYKTFHRRKDFRKLTIQDSVPNYLESNPVNGNSSIQGKFKDSEIVITTTRRVAGAIHSLKWNGKEFIDSFDHGRQLQSAINCDCGKRLLAETFNPTEAGSQNDGTGEKSSSKLLFLNASEKQLFTVNQMAFWLTPGQKSQGNLAYNDQILSDHLVSKSVRIGYQNFPNVISYDVAFTIPKNEHHAHTVFEAVTGYMPAEFDTFWKFEPKQGKLVTLDDGPGEQSFPVVLSTKNGSHAMGVFSPDQPSEGFESVGYGRFRFPSDRVVKWNCVFRKANPKGISTGEYRFRNFVIIGTLEDVESTMKALHRNR